MHAMTRFTGIYLLITAILLPIPAHAEHIPITIFYTTDTHGHIVSDKETIGLDRIAAIKRSAPDSLLLDAGDFLHGTPLAGHDQGKSITALMCETGYFAAAAGNHEFSHGLSSLRRRSAEAAANITPMAILSANIYEKNGRLLLRPWAETTINNSKICVFGLTTPETKIAAMPSTVSELTFCDPAETSREMTAKLRASGCDLVVALVHVGSDSHVEFPSTALAALDPSPDVVIDGHSHLELANIVPGKAPVVSSGSHGKALGKLVLTLDSDTKKVTAVYNDLIRASDVADLAPDMAISSKVERLRKAVNDSLGEIITQSPADLPGDRETMRTRETSLGDMVADAMREAYAADIAIMNAGGIRRGLSRGAVTREDITAIVPFAGNVVNLRITGAELLDILENAVGKLPEASGAFPQVSGLSFILDPASSPGDRISNVRIRGNALSPYRTYILATNDFLAQGGDGYPHLAGKPYLQSWIRIASAIENHLKKHGITATLPAGRIHVVKAASAPKCPTP